MQPLTRHPVVRDRVGRHALAEVRFKNVHAHAQQGAVQVFEPAGRFGVGKVDDAHRRMVAVPQVKDVRLTLGRF